MRPLRILHISDLHERFASEDASEQRKAVVALDAAHRGDLLDERFHRELAALARDGIDLLCFTGDVADWALPEEYVRATARLERILAATNLPRDRIFVVPGNHDVQRFVNEETWSELRGVAAEDPSGIGRFMAGQGPPRGIAPGARDLLLERTSAFWRWVKGELGREEICPKPHRLGYRVTLPSDVVPGWEVPIQVIGFDSAWLCGDDNDVTPPRTAS